MSQVALFVHARSAVFGGFLFLAFVLAGSAYIVGAKLATVPVPAWQVTTVPLVLMILYAAILALVRYFRLRDDQAGDNLYYLGFLYTLTSLGVSLWQFRIADGGEHIVTNFGVAIASTILGVAMRVVFNQMRQDPVEVERVARLELADAARKIKQELDATTFEFASFRRSTKQMLEDSLREKREMSERLAKEIFESLAEIPKRSAEPLTTASEKSRDTIEMLAKAVIQDVKNSGQKLTFQEEKLATATEGVSTSLLELEAHLKAMQNPEGIIEIKLQPFIRGFTKAVNDHSKATDEQIAALQQVIATFDTSIQNLSGYLAQAAQERGADMQAVQQVIATFDTSIQNLSGYLAQAARERGADMQAVRDIAAKMQNTAAETQRLLTVLAERTASTVVSSPPPEPSRGWYTIFGRGSSS